MRRATSVPGEHTERNFHAPARTILVKCFFPDSMRFNSTVTLSAKKGSRLLESTHTLSHWNPRHPAGRGTCASDDPHCNNTTPSSTHTLLDRVDGLCTLQTQ